MLRDTTAEVAAASGAGGGFGVIPTYWTVTDWRSKAGFLGFTARTMTRTTARIRRAMKEKRRKRQQQQPLNEAEEEEWEVFVG